MYRYSVDNAITYTSEDFVLFRESPFACWMERLTLENPDHGIPADLGSTPPGNTVQRQDDLADTLRAEGKKVAHISWDLDEPARRAATLEAMRSGADYIVDGQLALGPLSGPANLLVRTSGYSELGDYLYTPCDTQAAARLHPAFRLCFLADLLHSLQGQLPPQMLLIRDGENVKCLPTDDHIYHYRAVKQRFMEAMGNFRKHRMPDPAESSHFGRWSDCVHEVLKQRMRRQEEEDVEQPPQETAAEGLLVQPIRQAAAAGHMPPQQAFATVAVAPDTSADFTLAEQARRLQPGTYQAGPGYFRLRQLKAGGEGLAGRRASAGSTPQQESPTATGSEPAAPRHNRRASDKALQNLEFIGSSQFVPVIDSPPPQAEPVDNAPSPSLRDPRRKGVPSLNQAVTSTPVNRVSLEDLHWVAPGRDPEPEPDTRDRAPEADSETVSLVDRDSYQAMSPPPVFTTADGDYGEVDEAPPALEEPVTRPFSNSIFNDPLFTDPLFVDSDTPPPRHGYAGTGHARPGQDAISNTLMTSDDFEE